MPASARKDFFSSPHHGTLTLAALGAAVFGGPLGAIIGGVVYVLGWVYLPDTGLFTRWRERKAAAALEQERQATLGDFAVQRDALFAQLPPSRAQQHATFVETCRKIAMGQDPRAAKLEEMQWTHLRLLGIEQTLEVFLEGERRDGVPFRVAEAKDEVEALEKEAARAKAEGTVLHASREKLLESRRGRLEVLQQRAERIEEAGGNAQLATAEIERLEEQAKLVRADAVAAKGAGSMSSRIDAAFEHLAQTNHWLAEMDQFRDQLGTLPEGGMGVVSPLANPALPQAARRSNPPQRHS